LIAELASQLRLPVIYPYRDYVDLGGFMTYAPDLGELAERMANDVHQIRAEPNRSTSLIISRPNSC